MFIHSFQLPLKILEELNQKVNNFKLLSLLSVLQILFFSNYLWALTLPWSNPQYRNEKQKVGDIFAFNSIVYGPSGPLDVYIDFGDGTRQKVGTFRNGESTQLIEHTYNNSGFYNVFFTVEAMDHDLSGANGLSVYVRPNPDLINNTLSVKTDAFKYTPGDTIQFTLNFPQNLDIKAADLYFLPQWDGDLVISFSSISPTESTYTYHIPCNTDLIGKMTAKLLVEAQNGSSSYAFTDTFEIVSSVNVSPVIQLLIQHMMTYLGNTELWGSGVNTMCLQMVSDFYGVRIGALRAIDGFHKFETLGLIKEMTCSPPVGSVVFCDTGNENGHVGISIGDDKMISVMSNGVSINYINEFQVLGFVSLDDYRNNRVSTHNSEATFGPFISQNTGQDTIITQDDLDNIFIEAFEEGKNSVNITQIQQAAYDQAMKDSTVNLDPYFTLKDVKISFGDAKYSFDMVFYPNPLDRDNIFWMLDFSSFQVVTE